MLLTHIVKNDSAERELVQHLYEESFPPQERMPFDLIMEINELPKVSLEAVYDDGKFIGFYLLMLNEQTVYVAFMAVMPDERLKGYGSAIINHLKKIYSGYDILLDEEPLYEGASNYEERVHRKAFYEKNGFTSTGYIIHAYGVDYEILTTSPDFEYEEYVDVFKNNGFDRFTPVIVRKPE